MNLPPGKGGGGVSIKPELPEHRMIPKTRSGKTLRKVLRELIENAIEGQYDKQVNVPATVEDAETVEVARARVKEWFEVRFKSQDTTKARL